MIAVLVTAWWVPADSGAARGSLRREVRAVTRLPVLLGLLMTTLGFGSMFTVYTYIQPLLTGITGFGETAVAPILLLFGVGMIVGNLLGGRLADRGLARALLLTLAGLAATMALMGLVLHSKPAMVLAVGLLGAAAFATGAPLQMWVLRQAEGAPNLASSLNIGAFNLGNAFGAWLGSAVLTHGPGLTGLPWIATLVPISALLVAAWAIRRQRGEVTTAEPGCRTAA